MKAAAILLLSITIFFLAQPPGCEAADRPITIGLVAEENIFRMIRRYRPLEEYLSASMGEKVKFSIIGRYADIAGRFNSGKLDGAFLGVFASVLAERQLGTVPLVRPDFVTGGTTARSYIFVRKDSGIRRLSDMMGKRFVFVDKISATGYLYALAYLRENGVRNPDAFMGEQIYTGSHDASLYTVLSGKGDVGVLKGRIFEAMAKNDPTIGEDLTVISKSAELPDTTLCVRGDLPEHIKKRLMSILLGMQTDPKGTEILKGIGARRFVKTEPSDDAGVERLATQAGVNIKGYKFQ